MSVPSSTSSSDNELSGEQHWRPMIWCVLFLFVFRLGLEVWGSEWSHRPVLQSAGRFLAESKNANPRVVAFGSSHLRSAFSREVWAKQAGLRVDQVLDLSVDGGRFFDARNLIRQANGLPESIELVLVEAPRWNFNRNRINPLTRERVETPESLRHQGTLADRLSVNGILAKAGLIAELAWPLYQRKPLESWMETAASEKPSRAVAPPPSVHWNPKHHAKLRRKRQFRAESIVRDHFADPRMSSFSRRNFLELIAEIRARGVEVAVLSLPTRDAYQEGIEHDPVRASFVAQVDAIIDSVAGNGVHVVRCERARDCGLGEHLFVDYGHLNAGGARQLTAALYGVLEDLREQSRSAKEENGADDPI